MSIKRIRHVLLDVLLAVFAFPAGLVLRRARRGWRNVPITRRILLAAGVFPVRKHYYEPVVYPNDLHRPLEEERDISGLNLNIEEQISLLQHFHFNDELNDIPKKRNGDHFFYYNGSFEIGDAEYLYNIIRHFKPRHIFEIGSGYSTLMARLAIERNCQEDPVYACRHVCVEPYEQPWLERTGAEVVRKRVELCDLSLFDSLAANDVLFIDSSHIIRPQGDVLYEFLEILGRLKSGVLVHVHDVFTPRDYPAKWVIEDQKLWNEQYLLEAFLVFNRDFRVIGALNFLRHNYRNDLAAVCPMFAEDIAAEPRSFWIQRN